MVEDKEGTKHVSNRAYQTTFTARSGSGVWATSSLVSSSQLWFLSWYIFKSQAVTIAILIQRYGRARSPISAAVAIVALRFLIVYEMVWVSMKVFLITFEE